MSLFSLTLYTIIVCIVLYLVMACLVLTYEMRLRKLYASKQRKMMLIESLDVSMAVKHAKQFKIEADYREVAEKLENKRLFIMKRVLRLNRLGCGYGG